jgi:hypothetical protein
LNGLSQNICLQNPNPYPNLNPNPKKNFVDPNPKKSFRIHNTAGTRKSDPVLPPFCDRCQISLSLRPSEYTRS